MEGFVYASYNSHPAFVWTVAFGPEFQPAHMHFVHSVAMQWTIIYCGYNGRHGHRLLGDGWGGAADT